MSFLLVLGLGSQRLEVVKVQKNAVLRPVVPSIIIEVRSRLWALLLQCIIGLRVVTELLSEAGEVVCRCVTVGCRPRLKEWTLRSTLQAASTPPVAPAKNSTASSSSRAGSIHR